MDGFSYMGPRCAKISGLIDPKQRKKREKRASTHVRNKSSAMENLQMDWIEAAA